MKIKDIRIILYIIGIFALIAGNIAIILAKKLDKGVKIPVNKEFKFKYNY